MPAKRSAMRKIKEVLQLKFEARLSHKHIAAATDVSKDAVSNYVQRAIQKGLGWPLPAEMDDVSSRPNLTFHSDLQTVGLFHPLEIRTWTPPLCQAISSFRRAGMDCTRTSGLFREMNSLSLMGFADRLPIVNVHLTYEDLFGFCRPGTCQ